MEKKNTKACLSIISSMIIFGTIGLVRKNINMPSGCLAMTRGIIGGSFLLIFYLLKEKKFAIKNLGKTGLLLLLTGAMIGVNWIALFEAYRYTTVATATLCYYMAPVFIIIASRFCFNEKLGLKKLLCVITALIGMVLVSGILNSGFSGNNELIGIGLGLFAALLYATIIILNKFLSSVPPYEKTIIQLIFAGIAIAPYVFIVEDLSVVAFDTKSVIFLTFICIVHTGLSYILYFGSIPKLPAQTSALLSYIDPVVAVLLSALVLKEPIGISGIIGAVMIIGAMLVSEL